LVYPENIAKNLDITKGLYFSEGLLLRLVDKGVLRQKAYEIVQSLALRSFEENTNFKDIVMSSPDITTFLSREEIEEVFDLNHHLRNIDFIFEQVIKKYK